MRSLHLSPNPQNGPTVPQLEMKQRGNVADHAAMSGRRFALEIWAQTGGTGSVWRGLRLFNSGAGSARLAPFERYETEIRLAEQIRTDNLLRHQ